MGAFKNPAGVEKSKTMAKQQRRGADVSSELKNVKGDSVPFRQVFDQLSKTLDFSEGLVVTSLPRGSLQIAQPARVREGLLRDYSHEFHAEDRPTWQTTMTAKPLSASDCWKDASQSR